MSAAEEKGNNNDEETALNEDLLNLNTETRSESELPSIKSAIPEDAVGGISKNNLLSPSNVLEESLDKEIGDTEVEKANENINIDKKDKDQNLDFGTGSGDTANEAKETIIDRNPAITSMDMSVDSTDADDMELKWDEDDDDEGDENNTNVDQLTEEQLLQDDTSNTEMTKTIVKDSEVIDETILDSDSNAENSENREKPEQNSTEEVLDSEEMESIDTGKREVENDKEIDKLNTESSLVKEDSQEKTEELALLSSDSLVEELLDDDKDIDLEVAEIQKIIEDTRTKCNTDDDDKHTELIDDGDDLSKENEERLLETDNSPIDKIPETEMDVSMDNINDVNEEELLKGNEKEVLDDSQSKTSEEIVEENKKAVTNDEIQVLDDDQSKISEEIAEENKKEVMDDEKQVLDEDQSKISEEIAEENQKEFMDDEKQVLDEDQSKISEEIAKENKKEVMDDEKQVLDDDQSKISEEIAVENKKEVKNDEKGVVNDNNQDEISVELHKDDENQAMNVDNTVNDQTENNDQETTTSNEDKTTDDDQNKMDDENSQMPSNLTEETIEKADQTPETLDTSDKLDSNTPNEKEKIELVPESKSNENIEENTISDEDRQNTIDQNAKSVKKLLDDLTKGDVIEETEKCEIETKINDENKELTNLTADSSVETEEKTKTNEELQEKHEKEIPKANTIEGDRKSNICLEDSPIRVKQAHSLHKPDAMLEIPSQDLIDIDAELSMNLEQSDILDAKSDKDVGKNIKDIVEDVEKEKDRRKDGVQETVEEGMERMFADNPVVKDTDVTDIKSKDTQQATLMETDPHDLPEMTDSLGLLAESARGRGDDEENDDDDDDYRYESSNQVSPDQSDDSNAPHSETDAVRETQSEKEIESPGVRESEFQFTISNVESTSPEKVRRKEVEKRNATPEVDVPMQAESEAQMDVLDQSQNEVSLDQEKQMDVDTVKLSDTSDNEEKDQNQLTSSQMKERDEKTPDREPKTSPSKSTPIQQSPSKTSPSKIKKLEIKKLLPSQIVNIVDLQESSSEDELQPQEEDPEPTPEASLPPSPDPTVTTINFPSGIEVMTSGGTTSELVSMEGEIVVSIPIQKPHRPTRLNTSEVTIKTVSNTEPMVIPETKINLPPETQIKPKLGLEIFSLDSDEDESVPKAPSPQSPEKPQTPERRIKCMNYSCSSDNKVPFLVADARVTAFYEAGRKRRTMVCEKCANVVYSRAEELIEGIKDFTPLLDLQMSNQSHELVEISDSESEDEEEDPQPVKENIGEKTAKFLEENLAEMFNSTWKKYELDARLKETQILLEEEMDHIERETKDLDNVFASYQQLTDTLRRDLYATFSPTREELPVLIIVDKPGLKFVGHETHHVDSLIRAEKRRKPITSEQPVKRPAIPLGYAPLDDSPKDKIVPDIRLAQLEEDKDISVVRLSMELAPADLPPPGTISRPPLRVGMPVYAMKNAFGPWLKGRILEIQPRAPNTPNSFSVCRVKFDHKTKTNAKILPARCVAYAEPSDVRMTIGTRLIALFKDSNKRESYYSGVVAEIPNPVNSYRYLVFFDDGYAQYVHHPFTRLVCESSPLVWEEVHPFSREFVMDYLLKYPERPMVRLHEGQHLKTEWNGKWWPSRVSRVDASLAQVMFVGDGRREWVYRGSTRLAPLYLALKAAERHRPRPMPRSKAQPGSNMPYVEYTRSDEPEAPKQQETQVEQQQAEETRHQRAVAKKSTASHVPPPPQDVPKINVHDSHAKESRVVYYTPKNAVRPYKMTPHRCGPQCKRSDVLTLKELRTYNPLAKPLLSGWERQLVRFKGNKEVMYRAPCGRRLRNMRELHHYLRLITSELPVDLFDFNPLTHCLAEFVMHKCLVGKKDLSHGKENVPVPCVNFFDESLPEFCSYNTERTPTAGVPLNLDPEFLCGCDCTDDCADKEKCACWRMTLEGAKTIGLEGPSVGYVYKRLPEPLPSGIYECNSRCKCKDTCLNRVAQHPLQLKLQVFKTENRGWGIRALNDVPKGSFLCVYAGNLLTDATANLDGLNEGDEYLAELDYIEVVEQMKEGYEEDIPEADKKLDKKDQNQDDDDDEESESSPSEDDDTASKTDKEDDDFRPGHIGLGVMEFNKRLRRRGKKIKEEPAEESTVAASAEKKDPNGEEDCITISDDEEVREPSSFTVKAGMGANDFVSKYRSVRSYFGEDEACYIMDAKVQGNIGRYLNHSCCPNVFVQNVFVDTHDPRFPWVAFFALSHIKAGTELTWNYNYDVGSVPGKVLYCYCGAPNCRGRLL
ncbi:histone-lysine N-methyltransferase eggless isoform X2 [Trichoplusia ni]|uniref:Histone-lysine N-methyltransferase eggless isoform X2 n=1 Tax=Trichoplusia ni TaxID=7111 RepID=A0A7E5WGV5_TRINI|nr:histone-lysine N-methyltransferase eggless isoform X2 [Trichoplusia ni]